MPDRVGLETAQRFYDHVSREPGKKPTVGATCLLRGKAGKPAEEGFSRTYHYEISGAGRIDYQFHDAYTGGTMRDPHRIVRIMNVDHRSH